MPKIIRNMVKCHICGDIIESKHVHDFVTCKCGACSVDGGHLYLRRAWDPQYGEKEDIIEEMNEVEEDE